MYRGAKFSMRFSCFAADKVTPLNLTGLGPFVMEVRRRSRAPLLLSLTFTATNLAQGKFQFVAESGQTDTLPIGQARYGIRDALDNLYAEGIMDISAATPEPSTP